jgi:hypothetical protein
MSATRETDKRDVAADVSSAVEGGRPAARKKPSKLFGEPQTPDTSGYSRGFIRWAGRPGSTAGRMPATTCQCMREMAAKFPLPY